MLTFHEWLQALVEDRRHSVEAEILKGYDLELQHRLEQLADGIPDQRVRMQFEELLRCPLVDAKGNCRGFAEYVLAALIRNGISNRFDIHRALQYVFEKLLVPKGDAGHDRTTIFTGFDSNQPDSGEHFRAKFLSWVKFAVGNIRKGKIRHLASVEPRPPGTVSIGQGRERDQYTPGTVSPEQIADRPSPEAEFTELVSDITNLLKKKEAAYGLPLADVFTSMLSGKNVAQQRTMFGDSVVRMSRPVILRLVGDYAQEIGNYQLMALVQKYQDFRANQPATPARPVPEKPVQPVMTPQERDYASIIDVVDRFQGQPVGTAQLGSYRRRWLDYPPRDPSLPHRNRLDQTLDFMLRDGALRAVKGNQGAVVYLAGPNYEKYRRTAAT